jgi:hypothetical protein
MLTTGLFVYCYTGARLGAIIPLDSTVEARNSRIKKKEQRIVRPGSNFARTTSSDEDELSGLRWRVSMQSRVERRQVADLMTGHRVYLDTSSVWSPRIGFHSQPSVDQEQPR